MSEGKTGKTWSKTSVQNLVKHRRGGYYSRLFIGGKERWKSLRTKVLAVAKARLREEQRNADQFAHLAKPTKSGRLTMSMAVETLLNEVRVRLPMRRRGRKSEIIESSAAYREETVGDLRRTWAEITGADFDSQETRAVLPQAAQQSAETFMPIQRPKKRRFHLHINHYPRGHRFPRVVESRRHGAERAPSGHAGAVQPDTAERTPGVGRGVQG